MTLTLKIGSQEISTDPAQGVLTGDAVPASTQAGVVTKLARISGEEETDLLAVKTIFDDHDHDPATGTGPGGQPIGTGGVRALEDGAVTMAKLAGGGVAAPAVTDAKVANDSINTINIVNDSITDAKLGDAARYPLATTLNVQGNNTATWSPPTLYPIFHIEGLDSGHIQIHGYGTGTITFTNPQVGDIAILIVYRGSA